MTNLLRAKFQSSGEWQGAVLLVVICLVLMAAGFAMTISTSARSPLPPIALGDVHDTSFDLIVTLSPEAHHKALALAGSFAIDVEYWPTPDPTMTSGNREQILTAYRGVRDGLFRRIKQRFPVAGAPNV